MKKKCALTIAGSDSSGGAGIQADLKTMYGCGVYGMSAITAVTAQNTTGVKSIMKVSKEVLSDQLDMVFTDIFPDAVKIGMTFQSDLIEAIADRLKFYNAKNKDIISSYGPFCLDTYIASIRISKRHQCF